MGEGKNDFPISKQSIEIADECKCTSAGYVEIPNSGDDASYPRDYYSDSFPKNDKYAKSVAINGFLGQLGYSGDQIKTFCKGVCNEKGKECRKVGILTSQDGTIQMKIVTMKFPDGSKRQMYWAHAKTRGKIKIKATCECISVPKNKFF